MSKDPKGRRGFRITQHAPDVTRDLGEEIAFHLAMRERELLAAGHSPEEAKRLAAEAFGDERAIAEACTDIGVARVRQQRVRRLLESVLYDARFAFRSFRRAPVFALFAIGTLALGIGANVAIFGLIEAALMRAPEVRSPETLVAVYTTCRLGDLRCASSYPDYIDYRERTRALADLAAYDHYPVTVGDNEGATAITAALVTGNYFRLLGVTPQVGRMLLPEDDVPGGATRVIVLSHALWQGRFGGDPAIIGERVRLNGESFTVVGIAPADFLGLRLADPPEAWVPFYALSALYPDFAEGMQRFEERGARWITGLVGRLAPGATVGAARAELLAVSDQLALEDAQARGPRRVTVDALDRYIPPGGDPAEMTRFAAVLQGVVGLTLLLACANLANLLLARTATRRQEMAVRVALGAGRARLLRQMLTESMLLSTIGGALGIALAYAALNGVASLALPFGLDGAALGAAINGRLLLFALGVSVLTGVLFGLLPALTASHARLSGMLRTARTGTGVRAQRARSALVAVQLALCLLLLSGAGLFLRTLVNRLNTDVGFEPDGLAAITVDPSMNRYPPERVAALERELRTQAGAIPGAVGVATATRLPVEPGGAATMISVQGYEPAPDEELRVQFAYVSPNYFETLRIPVRRGRSIEESDAGGAQRVLVIDERAAQRWWPDSDPVGAVVTFRGETHLVVGVVSSTVWGGMDPVDPFLFAALAQNPERVAESTLTVLARTHGAEQPVLDALAASVRTADRGLAIINVRTMRQSVAAALSTQRSAATLLTAFALLALFLALIGIYGVVGYLFEQRRRDIGVRVALGASGGAVVGLLFRSMIGPVLLGLSVGVLAALALTRVLQSFLFNVGSADPLTFVVAIATLLLGAGIATLIPARRALSVQPVDAMRHI